MRLKDLTGQKIPDVTFKVREDFKWVTKTTDDYFKGKKVVLFALPGAFTPTCSSVHLPRYNELAPAFKRNGIDDIICLSVNDSFVLNEWKKAEKADAITMLPDGNGELSEKMGFLVDKRDLCFGQRSWRYSMLVEDKVIKKMFLEPEEEGDPYGTSSAETMLKYLNPKEELPASVTVYTKEGCPYCAKAKDMLREREIPFEEHVLNRDFTIKTLKAISNGTMVPQIFIDGSRISGSDNLEKHFGANIQRF